MQIRFKYLVEDRDRHGNVRLYVRVPGRTKVRIRAPFGTDEFIAAYNAAISDHVTAPRQAREAKAGIVPTSLRAVLRQRHVQAARQGHAIMAAPGAGCHVREARRQTGRADGSAPCPGVPR